jgi:hypothetical protein
MTPQERHLIDDLFDRLAGLETAHRDPEAERAIIEGLRRAPNAAYALVQTVLLQDEALKRANARIEELQGQTRPQPASSGSFLDSMRDAVFGQSQARGSVPSVKPAEPASARPVWNSGQVVNPGYAAPPPYAAQGYGPQGYPAQAYAAAPAAGFGGGGSFLGTAAAVAAGAIGGSLLMGGIRGLMGGQHQAFGDVNAFGGGGPWAGDQSGSDLARDAGVNDIGQTARFSESSYDQPQGLFDTSAGTDSLDGDDDGFDGDSGGGDSDFA